ncbi:hypothetical protein DLAC_05576 [Tieghemostelium lacteum]|uniref:Uncharacterized protein n=1 Tax=Tieghemostelium lacteum TaxID=361077 RepID=A0A151ZGI3_TIELA|nr:hypothetical protein DLAC_05576 [Tieghemostelium lacteum]|eukprot:KYQ92974.1 hypothetical protein DLAC_05576 [Tieghemostelium lacteum]
MTTLSDLINELIKQNISLDEKEGSDNHHSNNNNNGNTNSTIDNEKTFNQLSTYLPIIPIKNLESFIDDTKNKFHEIENYLNRSNINNNNNNNNSTISKDVNKLIKQFYRINNSFYDTINESSLKYNSIIRKQTTSSNTSTTAATTSETNTETINLANNYSSIYYLFNIHLFKLILKMEFDDIVYLLNDYYIEDDVNGYDDNDDEDSDYENIDGEEYIENVVINTNAISSVVDEDDYVYEPFQTTSTDLNEFYQDNKVTTWLTISRKLEPIIKALSYDNLIQDTVWEDFSILEDIQEISTLLFQNQNLKEIYDYFPNFIYLLRDRIVHKTTDIPYILPIIFKVIQVSPDESSEKLLTPFQFKTILSILDSLVCINNLPTQSILALTKYILKYMNYFLDRLSFWVTLPNELFNQINSKFELESILNIVNFYTEHPLKEQDNGNWSQTILNKGIFSQYMNLVITKLLVNSDETSIRAVSMFCCKSEMLSHFIQKVPEFIDLVLKNERFSEEFDHYRTVWFFILSIHPLNQSDKDSYTNQFIDGLVKSVEKIESKDKIAIQKLETILSILVISKQSNSNQWIFSNDSSPLPHQLLTYEKKLNHMKTQLTSTTNTSNETTNEFQIFSTIRSYLKYLRGGANK